MVDTAPTLALRLTRYIPHRPTIPQIAFLLLPQREALYGGAARGGKSEALLMGALQWVDVPGYSALILRRTFQQLSKADMLIPRAHEWLSHTDARWDDEHHTFLFPSGATLAFGHIEHENDKYNFQGGGYQYIALDELTQFRESMYRYMFSRLSPKEGVPVPLRMRTSANPGGEGHAWVKARFLGPAARAAGRIFIPARLEDNPHVGTDEYDASLQNLDPVEYAQLRWGNWDVEPEGDLFAVDRLVRLGAVPMTGVVGRVRYWDKAGTAEGGAFTVGARLSRLGAGVAATEYAVEDLVRGQWGATARNAMIRRVAAADPPGTVIWIEQEPGSGGKESAEISVRELAGYDVRIERVTGAKIDRARPFAAQVGGGNVGYVRADWNRAWLDELRPAPNGVFWDQIDATGGAFNKLALLQPDAWAPLATVPARDWSRMRTT